MVLLVLRRVMPRCMTGWMFGRVCRVFDVVFFLFLFRCFPYPVSLILSFRALSNHPLFCTSTYITAITLRAERLGLVLLSSYTKIDVI